MDHVHEQKFALLQVNVPLDIIRTHLCSRVGPRAGIWLLTCLTTPAFHLFSSHFLTTLHTHSTIAHLS
jgi:hypothetical protein